MRSIRFPAMARKTADRSKRVGLGNICMQMGWPRGLAAKRQLTRGPVRNSSGAKPVVRQDSVGRQKHVCSTLLILSDHLAGRCEKNRRCTHRSCCSCRRAALACARSCFNRLGSCRIEPATVISDRNDHSAGRTGQIVAAAQAGGGRGRYLALDRHGRHRDIRSAVLDVDNAVVAMVEKA